MKITPQQALQTLYREAIQSRMLPPAALPELNTLLAIVQNALKLAAPELKEETDATE
jgi:hypothetical protein